MNKNINNKNNTDEIFEQIAKEIEAIDIENSHTNAVGVKIIAAKIIREHK